MKWPQLEEILRGCSVCLAPQLGCCAVTPSASPRPSLINPPFLPDPSCQLSFNHLLIISNKHTCNNPALVLFFKRSVSKVSISSIFDTVDLRSHSKAGVKTVTGGWVSFLMEGLPESESAAVWAEPPQRSNASNTGWFRLFKTVLQSDLAAISQNKASWNRRAELPGTCLFPCEVLFCLITGNLPVSGSDWFCRQPPLLCW